MEGRKTKPSPLGEILKIHCSRMGLSRRMNEQRLLGAWAEAVGEGVAERTQPMRIENGVLFLKVTNSVWMQQLQFMKELIIKKLHEKTGIDWVQDLRFYMGEVGDLVQGEERQSVKRDLPPPSESDMENIARQVSGVRDPEMKKILSELYSRALIVARNRENDGNSKKS
jgi:hypothetical protein